MTVNKPHTVLVLGAGYAGMMAALRLARRAGGGARVTLVNAGSSFVERIRLHQVACGQRVARRPLGGLLGARGVALRVGRVRAIDTERRSVDVDGERVGYDALVLALGSQADFCGVPGAAEHAHTLDAAGQARLQRALCSFGAAGRAVVAGGGLTAIEMATELAESFPGLRVSLVSASRVGGQLSLAAQTHVRTALARLGVDVVEGVAITEVQPARVVTSSGAIDAGLCIWAAGMRASPLLEQAGLPVNARGQAWVDATLRAVGSAGTSTWVAGDAAQPRSSLGAPIHMTCKTAMPLGAHAADNVARALRGEPEAPFSFGDTGYCVSLGRRDGVIQRARRDGTLADGLIVGSWAAFLKERVCAYTWWSLWLEARLGLSYRWFRAPAAASTAAVTRTEEI